MGANTQGYHHPAEVVTVPHVTVISVNKAMILNVYSVPRWLMVQSVTVFAIRLVVLHTYSASG